MPRGMLIVFEGIDGAGKRTQIKLLADELAQRNLPCETISFPAYESYFGRLIKRYLAGEFGPLDQVDPAFSAMLFAGDRLRQKPRMVSALDEGKTVLADRYVASNLAHQGARTSATDRRVFLEWLRQIEYGASGLPVEDIVLYLRIEPDEAQARMLVRRAGEGAGDLHESDLKHLTAAAHLYDELARGDHWITIDCVEPATGKPRTPAEIHALIMAGVDVRLARFRAMRSLGAPDAARD